ncbi:MAG: ARMT1-like domain-containing protein [Pseudomonadota bacterium]
METYLDCFPCFLRQALEASRMATENIGIQRKVLDSVMERLSNLSLDITPPEIAIEVHGLVKEITGNPDPYKDIKKIHNQIMLNLYPVIKNVVTQSDDRLLSAVKMAIEGNAIDLGVQNQVSDIEKWVNNGFSSKLAIDNYDEFKEKLAHSNLIVYLGDNTGEVVFDKILVEEIKMLKGLEITFVVRGSPIINDVTVEDADFVGMKELATVVSNGSSAPGTILSQCSPEILDLFSAADMIIAKGQGNYESLSEEDKIFFLLKVKCPVVARELGVDVGDTILKSNSRGNSS